MRKTIRKTIKFELMILRQELQNKATSKEHKQLAYTEISSFVRGFCYGLSGIGYNGAKAIISENSYKLITNYMDRLCDKYIR